jgi:transposase-like protein
MSRKGMIYKKIPLELRLEAIRERIEERKSYAYLGQKYGVSRKTIFTWMSIYKRDGSLDISKKGRSRREENIDYKEKYEILKKFQDYLKEVDQEKK